MRIVRGAAALVLIATLALAAPGCDGAWPDGVVYPSITPDASVSEDRLVTAAFHFEGEPVTITLDVDGALYAGAVAAEKSVVRFGGARETDWIEDYYPAFIAEEHQDAFFADVLGALRSVRDERGLDGDRYAELLAVFVQSLEYRTDPQDLSPKFPVETFVEQAGDCDDKTLLLAGLLSREGYDVAVLLFEPEQHVALGIRSADIDYRDTGYAFVETTTHGFIGMVPDELAGGLVLESDPRVFAIDGGTTAYGAGAQVRAILDGRDRAIALARDLSAELDAADATIATLEAETRAERARLDALSASGRIAEYNAGIAGYNDLVARYNTAIAARNTIAERYNDLANLEADIVAGLDDRVGTYARVAAAAP